MASQYKQPGRRCKECGRPTNRAHCSICDVKRKTRQHVDKYAVKNVMPGRSK